MSVILKRRQISLKNIPEIYTKNIDKIFIIMYNEPKFILYEVFAMPKIIDNLEEKIHNSAFKLFSERDYGSVSMKTVAEDVGIAVGTVYNYHGNKKELFLSVLKYNIDQIYLNLNELIEEDCNLFEFITAFYDEITRIGGFSEEILRNNIRNEDIEEMTIYIDQILRFEMMAIT